MKKLYNIKQIKLYLFLSFIFLFLMLFNYVSKHPETVFERTINNVWRLLYVVVLNYILFEYIFPFIGRKRKNIILNILVALPFIFLYMMLYSFGLYAWRLLGIAIKIYTPLYAQLTPGGHTLVQDQMVFSMSAFFIFGIGRHIYTHTQLRQAAQKLRIEKQAAELNYLKSQTNPHFLFNTLNNIYSLARDKSDRAPESILRLSTLLRFMLYETGGDFISIEQELKIINDYIELEKLRYDESLHINFNHNIEDMKQAIPPLLLIPLVENAFKHGVSETRGRPFIDIHLSINNRQLLFVVKNSIDVVYEERVVKENIGLNNLRRQLELLYKEYELSVQPGKSIFTAVLKINLASHV